jgi:hypothetical protein
MSMYVNVYVATSLVFVGANCLVMLSVVSSDIHTCCVFLASPVILTTGVMLDT